jgi:hypothetical protein
MLPIGLLGARNLLGQSACSCVRGEPCAVVPRRASLQRTKRLAFIMAQRM